MNELTPTVAESRRESGPPTVTASVPGSIGRYRVERLLGQGGFGLVYLAHDDQLRRPVAVKVPHPERVQRPEDAEACLREARTVATLDHPHIVPVYDVGSTESFPCFIVSRYIDGCSLAERLQKARLSLGEAADLLATVAEALHYAHKQGIVHRDVKPGNILLDKEGKPHIVDFGLALHEQDVGKGPCYAGTPVYMSPEQARGEGHRVDGRSDVFSLGVTLYELLSGRQPFHADAVPELLAQIATQEVRPLRQWDDRIPRELERICLKALSKRAADRYTTAHDLADDLRHFLREAHAQDRSTITGPAAGAAAPSTPRGPAATPANRPAIPIVPKGLRSFDAGDADFFLELLPGPRDRDGLPDGIRFWKSRIETADADGPFAVGLIYGPSGCGKSSLVKAGLLPRLARSVTAVHVEVSTEETETRLLRALRHRLPDLPADTGLVETLAALRQGRFLSAGQKVLLVLDQFEQWLHARESDPGAELVQALRQCDGGRLQALVLVRDDFWMAATRFMAALEIDLVQGQNCAAVDRFDPQHARKVLAAFGQAYGHLPADPNASSKEQRAFLDQVVAELAEGGKVISVRLALFAEMVKGKPWTPATLREVGGIRGVGVTFLEETFSAAGAPPPHRLHQKAAQAVLKALLPAEGTDIKGHRRSRRELLTASGYADRPRDFAELLRILDSEVRLITPTDREGNEATAPAQNRADEPYYQLTHDYLVHALREWLTRKQKETRRGRAELLLADRAAAWEARPEHRQLPSLGQWLQIRWLTAKRNWTPPQQRMMRRAGRYHALRAAVVVVLLAVAAGTGLAVRDRVTEQHKEAHAADLVQNLVTAETDRAPDIVGQLSEYRRWADPLLWDRYRSTAADSREKLHVSLALLPEDETQVDYLYGRLLAANPGDVPVLRDALLPYKDRLVDGLWRVAARPPAGKEPERLRAAAALAMYDPASERWAQVAPSVAGDLLRANPIFLGAWSEAFRPVKNRLLGPLAAVFRHRQPERAAERSLATNLLADYASDQPQLLADLLMDADETQFGVIFPKLQERAADGLPVLLAEIDTKLPADFPSADARREKLARRQANAAVAVFRLGRPGKVWPLMERNPRPDDPRLRSYLIHRLGPLGADPAVIVQRLGQEAEMSIRRALLLSLGEFDTTALPPRARQALLPRLQQWYRTEPDAGFHAAAEWLLRRWNQGEWLARANDVWAKDRAQRAKRVEEIAQHLRRTRHPATWYVNGQGQTMVVVPGPAEFRMGSPAAEVGRNGDETPHPVRIRRSFALTATPVTLEQFRRFEPGYGVGGIERWVRTPDSPVIGPTWFDAAAYCNWLSRQEGLPPGEWCYVPVRDRGALVLLASSTVGLLAAPATPWEAADSLFAWRTEPHFQDGMRLAPNYLERKGYRLPTEAEIEYATRAGAITSRFYGESEELLEHYAWYLTNARERTWPVGLKKPNDLGLFDAHGNVFTWCQERYGPYPGAGGEKAILDREDIPVVRSTDVRALRGGSFGDPAAFVRSADRLRLVPEDRRYSVGFRPARTIGP